jgi:hypothetical protein
MTGAMLGNMSSGKYVPLILSIGPGQSASGASPNNVFSPNTATVTGGSGTYTYVWTEVDDSNAKWVLTNATTATCTPAVRTSQPGTPTFATVTCTVTDTVTMHTVSTSVVYEYIRTGTPP